MTLATFLPLLSWTDLGAAAFLIFAWCVIGWRVENPSRKRPSVNRLMRKYRRDWMIAHIDRAPRVHDATLLASLREGTAFFASACLIAIGGGLALIGNTDRLDRVAEELMLGTTPAIIWEVKILLPLLLVTSAFMRFVWAQRVFGYCAVMMGAVPNDLNDPKAMDYSLKAAELNIEAARAFNRGLRGVYFALGSLGWFLGPEALIGTTLITVFAIWQREFSSRSRALLHHDDPL